MRKALQQVDQVSALLRKMGLRDAGVRSPATRPDHAVEKRMCNACWANPDRVTGCEHHPRVLPTSSGSPLELQGPMSWQSGDLFVKYRSEADREALWAAFVRLREQQEQQRQRNDDAEEEAAVVLPEVARHPVWAKFVTQLELENLRTLAETRRRNLAKTFIFDVNHLWLTNLDHFNAGCHNSSESAAEKNALRGRRDDAAVRNGYSQIPSVSTARALTHARQSSFSDPPKPPTSVALAPDVPVSRRRRRRHRSDRDAFYPLSLLVCGYQPPASDAKDLDQIAAWLDQVPGVALVGSRPVLWWSYLPDRQAELASVKDGDECVPVEFTKAVALFARDAARSSSNAVLVLLVVAIDAPVLAPTLFAWHVGSKQPPPCPTTSVAPPSSPPATPHRIATLVSPKASQLLAKPVETRLDTLLPCSLVMLNCMSTPEDHQRLPSEACGHRREWDELDSDAFRQWLRLDAARCLLSAQFVPVRDVGVSAATLNAPHVGGRYCWHETRAVDYELVRTRTARDYLYVVFNTPARGGSNDATLFAIAMAHERMLDVRNCGKLAQYMAVLAERRRQEEREQELREVERKLAAGRLLLEAKRQEQQRTETALQVAAARAQDRLDGHHTVTSKASDEEAGGTGEDGREWMERVAQSVVEDVRGGWERRVLPQDDGVAFYRSVNDQLPARHRFWWQPPIGWDDGDVAATAVPPDSTEVQREDKAKDDGDSDDDDSDEENAGALEQEHAKNAKDMATMARELLSDAQFLSLLKEKLGLPPDPSEVASSAISSASDASNANSDASRRQSDVLTRLGLGSTGVYDESEVSDASKAGLVASRMAKLAIPVHLEPSRPVVAARGRPGEGWKRLARSKLPQGFARRVYEPRVQGPRSAFVNQPNHATPVGMLDPTQWSEHDPPEFIPELRALLVPRAASDLQEKKAQWADYERRARVERPAARAEAAALELEGEAEPQETTMEQKVARAVLCARNNNLEGVRTESVCVGRGWGRETNRACVWLGDCVL